MQGKLHFWLALELQYLCSEVIITRKMFELPKKMATFTIQTEAWACIYAKPTPPANKV
jgi:hypothetical protein